MNLWLIGQPGPASSRNATGKAQGPTAAIGGGFSPNPFLNEALPEVGFGSCVTNALSEYDGAELYER